MTQKTKEVLKEAEEILKRIKMGEPKFIFKELKFSEVKHEERNKHISRT